MPHPSTAAAAAGEAFALVEGGPEGERVHIDPASIAPTQAIDAATAHPAEPLVDRQAAAGLNGGNSPLERTGDGTQTDRLTKTAEAAGYGGGLGV